MPMSHPLRLTHGDDWSTEISEQPDGSLQVVVAGMDRREWRASCDAIEDAIALAYRIRLEQGEANALAYRIRLERGS